MNEQVQSYVDAAQASIQRADEAAIRHAATSEQQAVQYLRAIAFGVLALVALVDTNGSVR